MRPLKFESCLSVPNELRLYKNVPRLRPDVADGATNSADSPPRLCPDWPPNHQRAYFSQEARVSHDWAPTYPTALRTTPKARTSPGFSRLCHGGATNHAELAWFGLIRGSATKTLNFLKFSGWAPDQPRITKNHPDSPRTCYGSPRTTQTLLRLTPTHDS